MSYLLIKEDDSKIFKSFLSGNEIEVGVYVSSRNDGFDAGNEIEIFYDGAGIMLINHTMPPKFTLMVLMDATGKIIASQEISRESPDNFFMTGQLQKGIYFLSAGNEKEFRVSKVAVW